MNEPTFSVIVPTWRRPDALRVCLRALAAQTLRPGRVIVPIKGDDAASIETLSQLPAGCNGLSVVTVMTPSTGNFETQLNAGIAETTEPLVALTDDDAEPHDDWLRRMADHFTDPTVAGVGGRDWQAHDRRERQSVGKINWFGRVTGNHHLGVGPARDVDLLKGVNWAFRGDLLRAIGIDRRLRGRGNVTHTEMALCFALRRRGWTLIYDPAVAVEHHVAVRHDGDVNARGGFEPVSFIDAVHNETLAVLEHLPPARRFAFAAWAFLCGTGSVPGLLQLPRLVARRSPQTLARWRATVRGRWAGYQTFSRAGDGSADAPLPPAALDGRDV